LTDERVARRLAAVLAADVAGYSRLMGGDEEGTLARLLKAVRKAIVDFKIEQHRGRIVKTTGDGLLVEFASAVDAARCAVEVQSGMAEQNAGVPQDKRIEFRIGIHVGDIIIDDNDIFGDGKKNWRGAPSCSIAATQKPIHALLSHSTHAAITRAHVPRLSERWNSVQIWPPHTERSASFWPIRGDRKRDLPHSKHAFGSTRATPRW
jgi:hypothetical protein